jgi:SOS response regulatory protein OraA/RecX
MRRSAVAKRKRLKAKTDRKLAYRGYAPKKPQPKDTES